jgi:hypothetical protein
MVGRKPDGTLCLVVADLNSCSSPKRLPTPFVLGNQVREGKSGRRRLGRLIKQKVNLPTDYGDTPGLASPFPANRTRSCELRLGAMATNSHRGCLRDGQSSCAIHRLPDEMVA